MPNEVPPEFEDPSIDFPLRRVYEGMVHCLDSGINNITQALKTKGMFDKTLIVFRYAHLSGPKAYCYFISVHAAACCVLRQRRQWQEV